MEEKLKIKVQNVKLEIYPNPFSQKTGIGFRVESSKLKAAGAQLKIYDLSGRIVRKFPITSRQFTSIVWNRKDNNGRKVGGGVYFCRLEADEKILTKKMCVIK